MTYQSTHIELPHEQRRSAARSSGMILHPTSLPSEYGIGDLGNACKRFVDFLAKHGLRIWQVLPLGPTGYGDSPYQCHSAFAGNPLIISPDWLQNHHLLTSDDLSDLPEFNKDRVDFPAVIQAKRKILRQAFENFQNGEFASLRTQFKQFKENSGWLDDFALYMGLKEIHGLKPWNTWEEPLRLRDPTALAKWREDNLGEFEFHRFIQFIFQAQWQEVLQYANAKGVRIMGDIPIFVAYDSADTWANMDLFQLDEQGALLYEAGVPPDYFSQTGQLWGNPLYCWDTMRRNGYDWWIERIKHNLSMFDFLRLDHFLGFQAYWRIPAGSETAVNGQWTQGPGMELFIALERALGPLPFVAEDLGLITPPVERLRREAGFPGMRILQFAFAGLHEKDHSNNPYLPHNHEANAVVYTATHDNSTTKAWLETIPETTMDHMRQYIGGDFTDPVSVLIRLAWSSVADTCIIPLQDLMRLGDEARMNCPGKSEGNWEWRFTWDQLPDERGLELAQLNKLYGRFPEEFSSQENKDA